ncbi:hypothetical protein LXL04_020215 [Taraxacum kok-saghyz]
MDSVSESTTKSSRLLLTIHSVWVRLLLKYDLLILCSELVCPVNEFGSSSNSEPSQPCGNQPIPSSDTAEYVFPVVGEEFKPKLKRIFKSLDEGIEFYNRYAKEAGFDANMSTVKRYRGGDISTRYMICSRSGFSEVVNHDSTKEIQGQRKRKTSSKKKGCHDVTFGSYNIGATRAFTLLSSIKGGYDVSGGTVTDYKNFRRDLNVSVGKNDAQMLISRMENSYLTGVYWADEASRSNYKEFGDIVSFDATYSTNKYSMVFVPFTGIDSHRRCVTFGAGLLSDVTTESFVWLLQTFLKAFGTQPKMIVTDQDAALKIAVSTVLTESRHRLCMWHINRKLPIKTPHQVFSHLEFKKTLHKVVRNSQFGLEAEKWFCDMFDMRSLWIPSYLRDFPLSALMRTTSRSECENYVFSKFLHPEANFQDFMVSFENTMESNNITRDPMTTDSTWIDVIDKRIDEDDDDPFVVYRKPLVDLCPNTDFKVVFNETEDSFTCSCMNFIQEGFLCRHIFYVFNIKEIEIIPSKYILRRWRKHIIAPEVTCMEQWDVHAHACMDMEASWNDSMGAKTDYNQLAPSGIEDRMVGEQVG